MCISSGQYSTSTYAQLPRTSIPGHFLDPKVGTLSVQLKDTHHEHSDWPKAYRACFCPTYGKSNLRGTPGYVNLILCYLGAFNFF